MVASRQTIVALLAITLASASDPAAERLPLRQYLQRDGLAQNHVTAIHQDAKGTCGSARGKA